MTILDILCSLDGISNLISYILAFPLVQKSLLAITIGILEGIEAVDERRLGLCRTAGSVSLLSSPTEGTSCPKNLLINVRRIVTVVRSAVTCACPLGSSRK